MINDHAVTQMTPAEHAAFVRRSAEVGIDRAVWEIAEADDAGRRAEVDAMLRDRGADHGAV